MTDDEERSTEKPPPSKPYYTTLGDTQRPISGQEDEKPNTTAAVTARHTKIDHDGEGLTLFAPAQFLTGATAGLLAGYLDDGSSEANYGILLGASLALLQALDYAGFVQLPWNPKIPSSDTERESEQAQGGIVGFLTTNASTVGGFATGYFMGSAYSTPE